MKFILLLVILFSAVSCRNGRKPSDALAASNMAALEQTVDMENREVEGDGVLKFSREVVEMGEIPLGESRELSVEAVNRTDKPLMVLDAYTSCQCTRVVWDRKPVSPGGKTVFKVRFTAEQTGTFFKKIAVRHSAGQKPVTFAIQGVVSGNQKAE